MSCSHPWPSGPESRLHSKLFHPFRCTSSYLSPLHAFQSDFRGFDFLFYHTVPSTSNMSGTKLQKERMWWQGARICAPSLRADPQSGNCLSYLLRLVDMSSCLCAPSCHHCLVLLGSLFHSEMKKIIKDVVWHFYLSTSLSYTVVQKERASFT